jgi:hypothetical protein
MFIALIGRWREQNSRPHPLCISKHSAVAMNTMNARHMGVYKRIIERHAERQNKFIPLNTNQWKANGRKKTSKRVISTSCREREFIHKMVMSRAVDIEKRENRIESKE